MAHALSGCGLDRCLMKMRIGLARSFSSTGRIDNGRRGFDCVLQFNWPVWSHIACVHSKVDMVCSAMEEALPEVQKGIDDQEGSSNPRRKRACRGCVALSRMWEVLVQAV